MFCNWLILCSVPRDMFLRCFKGEVCNLLQLKDILRSLHSSRVLYVFLKWYCFYSFQLNNYVLSNLTYFLFFQYCVFFFNRQIFGLFLQSCFILCIKRSYCGWFDFYKRRILWFVSIERFYNLFQKTHFMAVSEWRILYFISIDDYFWSILGCFYDVFVWRDRLLWLIQKQDFDVVFQEVWCFILFL